MKNQLEDIKKNTLILVYDKNRFLFKKIDERGYRVENTFREIHKALKIFRFIMRKIPKYRSCKIWFGNWYANQELEKTDTIIIFGYEPTIPLVERIHKEFPSIRIIFWHWNPIGEFYNFKSKKIEQWTFDIEDSKKYNILFNNQYYFNDINLKQEKIKYDVLFIGADKGRYNQLIEIEQQLNALGLITYFYIVGKKHNSYISYEKILELISKSRAILDMPQTNQTGLTLRPLEALFFNKKLITTDKSISNQDIYHKDNIFILNKDSADTLVEFINKPFKSINPSIQNKYDFDIWIQNFWR